MIKRPAEFKQIQKAADKVTDAQKNFERELARVIEPWSCWIIECRKGAYSVVEVWNKYNRYGQVEVMHLTSEQAVLRLYHYSAFVQKIDKEKAFKIAHNRRLVRRELGL